MELITTLNKLAEHNLSTTGRKKLLAYLGKTSSDSEPLSLMTVLESNGIKEAVWCLRAVDYKEYCLFLADVAESVLHLYEAEHSNTAPRLAIEAIRKYHQGAITKQQLTKAAYAAADAAADAVTDAAAYAAYAATDPACADAARQAKWQEIEQLFIQYFGGNRQ